MRFPFAVAFATVVVSPLSAAELDTPSKIGGVTVFPSGAEIVREAKVKLDKGEHTLVFRDLPASAVQSSIRVEGKASGRLAIGSVDTRRLDVPRSDAVASATERRRIEDQIEALGDQKAVLQAQIGAAETQKTLITNLTQLPTRPPSGGNIAEPREDWTAILALISTASATAQRSLLEAQLAIRNLDRQISDLQGKLASLPDERVERTEVKVNVAADLPLDADIRLTYQVPNASWSAVYDARLATGSKTDAPKLTLTRRAAISQRTGEEWSEVALTLSTTRPTAGAAAPELEPMLVDIQPEVSIRAPAPVAAAPELQKYDGRSRDLAGGIAEQSAAEDAVTVRRVQVANVDAAVVAAPFQALFSVPGRVSVPMTGEAKRVQILEENVDPGLSVRAVPRVDPKAYLYAKLVLPKGTPLLAGPVALFRDGTFVGMGQLPVLSPGEEHELGFGIDDLVRVRHAIESERKGETGLISTSRTDTRNYRITVKNMHERAIDVVVLDQVPVAKDSQIKVEQIGKSTPTKENVDDKRGVLSWELKLEPDQEQVIEFGYRVVWPASKSVTYGN